MSNKVETNLLKKVLKLMCLFSVLAFLADISYKFLASSISEYIFMILHIVQILSVVIFLKCNHLSIRDCFTKRKTYFKSVVVSLVIGIILMLIGGMVDGLIPINNIENEVSENSMVYMIFVCIFAGIIAPVFEEIEFRALLFQNLHASSSFIFSILCSSLMFCVIHTGGINSGTFFMGIVSCLVLT